MVFEKRVLRRIFGSKRKAVAGRLLYAHQNYWGDEIKEDEIGGECRTHERGEKYI
jgi:hypothetical protein